MFYFPWLYVGMVLLGLFSLLILGGDWKGLDRKTRVVRLAMVCLVSIFIMGGLFVHYVFFPTNKAILKGFKHRIETTVNVENVQKWLSTLKYDHESSPTTIAKENWPVFVKILDPYFVWVDQRGILSIDFYGGWFYRLRLSIIPERNKDEIPENAIPVRGGYISVFMRE
jgi:hypothetical protein